MHYSASSPLQSQSIFAAGCPLVATSNDSCLSPVLFLYKSLTEVKQVASVRSICFCWPSGATGNNRSHTESWGKTLFLFLPELPQAVTNTCNHNIQAILYVNTGDTTRRQERVEPWGAGQGTHKFMPYILNHSLSTSGAECNCTGEQRAAGCANQAVTYPEEAKELKIALYLWLQSYSLRASNLYATCTIWQVFFGTLLVLTGQTQTSRQVPVPVIISYFCNNVAGVTGSGGRGDIFIYLYIYFFL